MRVVPTPTIDSKPMVVARLAMTMVMPVRAREYLDLVIGHRGSPLRCVVAMCMHVCISVRTRKRVNRSIHMVVMASHIKSNHINQERTGEAHG